MGNGLAQILSTYTVYTKRTVTLSTTDVFLTLTERIAWSGDETEPAAPARSLA